MVISVVAARIQSRHISAAPMKGACLVQAMDVIAALVEAITEIVDPRVETVATIAVVAR